MSASQHALRVPTPAETGTSKAAGFDAFVREHGDVVWRCLHALGVRRANLDDAAQDVFLVAFRQWPDYEERGAARSWLFAIAKRVAAGHHRRERPQGESVDEVRATLDVEDALANREARALLDGFLADLDEDRRLVFFLSDVEGWSAPEVALALEINLNTVYSRLRRSRAKFERFLRRRGGTP
jgi:RNA polymerase sigma-70 factor (ECF subfamily)